MRFRILVVTLAVVVSAGLLGAGLAVHALLGRMGCLELPKDSVPIAAPEPVNGVTRFVALGDTGTGSKIQMHVARAARKICHRKGCEFAVLLGDNFYPRGFDLHDKYQFKRLIQRPYRKLRVPIFAVLGNHDLDRNPIYQVRLSRRYEQWRMPNFRYEFRSGAAHFFAVNSNCGSLEWLRMSDTVKREPDTWNFVLAHHPVYSLGPHGDSNWLDETIWSLAVKAKIDVELAGHNHILEHLQQPGLPQQYFVLGSSGGNSEKRSSNRTSKANRLFYSPSPGFAWLEVTGASLRVEIYDGRGSMLYSYDQKR